MTRTLLDSTSEVTYVASAVTVISGLTVNEWGVIIGLVIAVATFAVNWYYKHKTFKRGTPAH